VKDTKVLVTDTKVFIENPQLKNSGNSFRQESSCFIRQGRQTDKLWS